MKALICYFCRMSYIFKNNGVNTNMNMLSKAGEMSTTVASPREYQRNDTASHYKRVIRLRNNYNYCTPPKRLSLRRKLTEETSEDSGELYFGCDIALVALRRH